VKFQKRPSIFFLYGKKDLYFLRRSFIITIFLQVLSKIFQEKFQRVMFVSLCLSYRIKFTQALFVLQVELMTLDLS